MSPSCLSLAQRYPHRAAAWQLRTQTLSLLPLPRLMGIVNVTPDSFSDGGRFFSHQRAIEHGLRLAADGADLLDVGGESTRPYSEPVSADEELQRILPVVEALARQAGVPVSIDTSKAAVADAALQAGAQIVNDVTGLLGDSQMLETVLRRQAAVCVMHMQGTPQTMQDDPRYDDVADVVLTWLRGRRDALTAGGIAAARIALDPGIGFGKTHQHNLTLMATAGRLHDLGCPVLVGHSRKGFIGKVLGDKEADRTLGTVGAALALAAQGVQIIRVHDVRSVREALALFAACGGIDGMPASPEV